MRGSIGRKWTDLASFGRIRSLSFNDLGGKHLAPKAEVIGSNPVGCANDFNNLVEVQSEGKTSRQHIGSTVDQIWRKRFHHSFNAA
jgi:hypothetical protein